MVYDALLYDSMTTVLKKLSSTYLTIYSIVFNDSKFQFCTDTVEFGGLQNHLCSNRLEQ